MTLGEKLAKLRKEQNLTQEQLAEALKVSRQSIGKWESDLAYPETERLIQLSELFDCSLDYLLRDKPQEKEEAGATPLPRVVTLEEGERFLSLKEMNVLPTAVATFLCIISPLCLMFLGALSERPGSGISEEMAAGIGMIVLLLLIAVAVFLFIMTGKYTAEFAFLEKEEIQPSPELVRLVREKKESYRTVYTRGNAIGTLLCILSVIPLFLGVMFFSEDDVMMVLMVDLMLLIIGIGVICLIRAGMPWASFNKLLQEEEYTPENKAKSGLRSAVSVIYWLSATAIFLVGGFLTENWKVWGYLWPVAGVLYPVVLMLCRIKKG